MEFDIEVVLVPLNQKQLRVVKDWMTAAVEISEDVNRFDEEHYDAGAVKEVKELEALFESYIKNIITVADVDYDCSLEQHIRFVDSDGDWDYEVGLVDLEQIVKEDKGWYYYIGTGEYNVYPQYLYIGPKIAGELLVTHKENWEPYQGD